MSNNANDLLGDMSRDYLEIELDAVKNENMVQNKRIEEYKIQINKLKRRMAISNSMEVCFKSEIESLKNIHDAKIDELLKKISIHEEQIKVMQQKHEDTVKFYETELSKKEVDVEYINEIKNSSHNITIMDDLISKLKLKIKNLTDLLTEYELKYKDVLACNKKLRTENIELRGELLKLREQSIEEEIQSIDKTDLFAHLQNEVSLVRKEINSLKDLPANL